MKNFRKASRLVPLCLGLTLGACSEQPQDPVAETAQDAVPTAPAEAVSVEKGVYVEPELKDYALHNEYDDDGDGDGTNETHVRRYINSKGDSAFSLTTNDKLWAWSVDTKAGDDADITNNYVIRDSNCDGVFDQRYSLNAKFHVPSCLLIQAGTAGKPEEN